MNTPTPELDKQRAVIESGASETVGDFYNWLDEKGYVLARWEVDGNENDYLGFVHINPQQLLAEFFGIDLDKIESERRAILEELRSA
jgi:nucleoside-specific outer membrane channel protein Tsx